MNDPVESIMETASTGARKNKGDARHFPRRGNSILNFLSHRADELADWAFPTNVTPAQWTEGVEARRRAFRRNLGLDPFPGPRETPVLRELGEFSGDGFRARKLGYELIPGCWGAATIYYPDPLPSKPSPGVLYVCGHTATGVHHFHPHPVMWARRGYVCLILDTIEQNDNPGEHHGFTAHLHHQRLSLGISASGLEVFNSLRALDVLAADSAVDAGRLGVTGVSGGGAMSFFVAALDERIRAVSTLCGLCSPRDALVNGHLLNHCDCMFPMGVEPMDTAEIATLIAPRAALFCFGNQDTLFHIEESCRIADQAKSAWELLGSPDGWNRVIADCPHGDHPEFDEATQKWFDQHLLREDRPLLSRGPHEIEESVTCVFQGQSPTPNRLHLLPELLVSRAGVPLPVSAPEWPGIREKALAELRSWLPTDVRAEFAGEKSWHQEGGASLTEWFGEIEDVGVSLRMRQSREHSTGVWLSIATGGQGWQNVQPSITPLSDHPEMIAAILEPRLSGWNYPGVGTPSFPAGMAFEFECRIATAMSLFGLTPVAIYLQDIMATLAHLRSLPESGALPVYLHARGEAAVAAVLAAALDDQIAGLVVEELPNSFADRAGVIGALRAFDIFHAVGLIAPRPVMVINPGDGNWSWPSRVFRRLGFPERFKFEADMASALESLFGSNLKRLQ